MSANINTVQAQYDALNTGNTAAFLTTLTEDCVWIEAEGSMVAGTHVGPQGVLDGVLRPLGSAVDLEIRAVEFMDGEDGEVLVSGTYTLTHRGNGRRETTPFTAVKTVRDGRVCRASDAYDTDALNRVFDN